MLEVCRWSEVRRTGMESDFRVEAEGKKLVLE